MTKFHVINTYNLILKLGTIKICYIIILIPCIIKVIFAKNIKNIFLQNFEKVFFI